MAKAVASKDISVSGKKIHAWIGGTGPALLLLHSAWGDARMSWERVWDELARSFTVIAPDMPGFAGSEPAAGPGVAESARVLESLLDKLKVDRATVVGNSMGVALAIEFASRFPKRTSRLVAVNGSSLPNVAGLMKAIIRIPPVERRFRRLMQNMSWSEQAFARGFPNPGSLPAGFIDKVRTFKDRNGPLSFDAVMNQHGPQSRPSVPTTVIWGTGDKLVSPGQMQSFRKWIGRHEYIPIEGAGHMPQVEQPKEFATILRRLLPKIAAVRSSRARGPARAAARRPSGRTTRRSTRRG